MASEVEVYAAGDAMVVNATSLDMADIAGNTGSGGGADERTLRMVQAALSGWSDGQRKPRRLGGVWNRDRFITPNTYFKKVQTARDALSDDVLGTAAEVSEALALAAMSVKTADVDEEDAWNQYAGEVNMDARLREFWQILYTDSSAVAATWWERRTYETRGLTKAGNRRRKKFDLVVPTSISFIDTLKVTPVGAKMFDGEGLAYIADPEEAVAFDAVIDAREGESQRALPSRRGRPTAFPPTRMDTDASAGIDLDDKIVRRLVSRRYEPTGRERAELQKLGVDCTNLFLLDNRFVFRHCLTKPTWQRFPRVRLESTFELLDLKSLLRQLDRAFLIAGASYIVLITQGSDNQKATQPELAHLRASSKTLGTMPIIVGPHTLSVEIITPKLDVTLSQERYDNLDSRLTAAAYGTFAATDSSSSDPLKTGRVIGKGFEGRRRMMRRSWEHNIFKPIFDTNESLTGRAKMVFHPGQISLLFDQALINAMLDLREAKEISRETILSQLDLDQADEAASRKREAEEYDDTFGTIVPHGANPAAPRNGDEGDEPDVPTRLARRSGGRRGGGNRNGGGAAPGSGQGEESRDPRRSRQRRPTDGLSRDDLIDMAGEYGIPGRHQMRKQQLVDAIAAAETEDILNEGYDDDDA